ncbi:unnamed protein product [Blumeria hordei]|uniref:Uncharacterized protein n=1 Tax=Blumeria hordei TaxID=2867405 RepID=A0A383UVQ0_BLUHO|nr:unnamed protein product [Blumeria hordei]
MSEWSGIESCGFITEQNTESNTRRGTKKILRIEKVIRIPSDPKILQARAWIGNTWLHLKIIIKIDIK